MSHKKKKDRVVLYKFIYTCIILFIYMIGRRVMLFGVESQANNVQSMNAADILMQTVGGDACRNSIFALGISPYMIAGIIGQMIMAYRKSVLKEKVSMIRSNRRIALLTFLFAIWQASLQVRTLHFNVAENEVWIAQLIAGMEMVVGVLLIMWLSERNKKYGFGGQTVIIMVNIIDGMMSTLIIQSNEALFIPGIMAVIMLPIMIIMENTEKRIPVQRVSIHNIYANENYLAIKLNPIGVMPMMFASAFFMLPQLAIRGLVYVFPNTRELLWLQQNIALTTPLGIVIYILILYFLTIFFSVIIISPGDLAEQFLKSGDSIVNIHAGDDTERYLKRNVFWIGFLSATVMSVFVAIPLIMELEGSIDSALVMFPTSALMLAGLWCTEFREFMAIRSFDAYKPFL